ncbi:hypothetical protein Dcar01_02376 [Deinococcus carri]|uniref:Uncharacterized protein n=1 Tax=Deinococcus carri TaxID=1211323 RepID=A0ABP9W8G2_9DEIO
MTVIAAVIHGGQVFMGADSLLSDDEGDLETTLEGKLWQHGDWLLGWAGGQRSSQVVRYAFAPPPRHEGQDVMAYLCTAFVDELRAAHANAGTLRRQHGQEHTDLGLLVGWQARLFHVSPWFCVTEYRDLAAIGSGSRPALAALQATPDLDPHLRLQRALEAAERLSEGVRRPFAYLPKEE